MRRGITLTEAVLAAALLASLMVGLFEAFASTRRFATSAEGQLSSALLAQMVVERVRSTVAQNPCYLRDLCGDTGRYEVTGTVVDPASATNAAGLKLSPFFEHLFARAAADLSVPANQVSIKAETSATPTGMKPEELNALLESYRDHQVKVTLVNDVDLENPAAPTAYAEAVKRLTVTVSRSTSLAVGGVDPLAYTLTTCIVTPAESLSADALEVIASRFDGPALADLWLEFFYAAASNPWVSTSLSPAMRRVVADVFLVVAAANNEALLVDGTPLPDTMVTDGVATARFIEPWIQELSAPAVAGFSSSKVELARLRASKAAVVFDAFKRLRHPGKHLCDEVLGPLDGGRKPLSDVASGAIPVLVSNLAAQAALHDTAVAALNDLGMNNRNVATLKSQGASLSLPTAQGARDSSLAVATAAYVAYREFIRTETAHFRSMSEVITVCAFLRDLLTDEKYKLVSTRPATYAGKFRTALDELSGLLEQHLDQVDGPTAYEHMAAALAYTEATAARQVERDGADTPARLRLTALAARLKPRMSALASYLTGDVHDLALLKARNRHFRARCEELQALSPRYALVIAQVVEGGGIDRFLDMLGDLEDKVKIDIGDTLGKLNDEIEKGDKDKAEEGQGQGGGQGGGTGN